MILDHHQGGDDLDAVSFKDTTAEATGRLVVQAAGHFGVPLTPEMARPLFAAIATDTGWFRFPSVGSLTFEVAAQLISAAPPRPRFTVICMNRNHWGDCGCGDWC